MFLIWGWELLLFVGSVAYYSLCGLPSAGHRHPAARSFAAFLGFETLWTLGYMAELASPSLGAKVFWDNVQFVPWMLIMPATLLFAWEYVQYRPRRRRLVLSLYMALPIVTTLWVLTDFIHGRARSSAHIEAAPPFGALVYDFTSLELVLFAQSYLSILYVVVVLLRSALRESGPLRWQALLVVLGLIVPTVGGTLSLFLPLWTQRDTGPAWFGLAALPVTYALYRGRFLSYTDRTAPCVRGTSRSCPGDRDEPAPGRSPSRSGPVRLRANGDRAATSLRW